MNAYDRDNALHQIAKRCNADLSVAVEGVKPRDYTTVTGPVFARYRAAAENIGATLAELKYHIAVMNGVITQR